MLGEKQKTLLRFLWDYQKAHGFLPTVREVMRFLGVRSTNTAQYHLNRLVSGGYLRREPGRARAFYMTDRARQALETVGLPAHRGIVLLGRITAGSLDLAMEDRRDELDLAGFVGADERTFALRVEGDSMTGAGIFDGDIVIVRRQGQLRDGEIGVVIVDGETTVKYVHFEPHEIVLRPANEQYREIRIARDHPNLEVCGRVIGVVRRL